MKIYPLLSSIFTSLKLVSYYAWVFRFLKRKILITLNTEENTWPFDRLEHYLELQSATKIIETHYSFMKNS